MGHDHHFLSRLDRIASAEVELALSLYRDHELVREVLGYAKLPEGAGRIAISLDDPRRGPFIIVARDGGFVTCLGRDMTPYGLPIVTRVELDGIAGKVHKLRERIQMAVSLTGGEIGKLISRLFKVGPRLTREEVMGLSAMQPLLWGHFLRLLVTCVSDVYSARLRLRNLRKPKRREYELLRLTWESLWAVGHLTALIGIDGSSFFDKSEAPLVSTRKQLLSDIVHQGVFSIALRGAWAASRIEKHLVGPLKQNFAESELYVDIVSSALGLAAIGHHREEFRAEVREALDVPKVRGSSDFAQSVNRLRTNLRAAVERSFESPEEGEEVALILGRAAAHKWLNYRNPDSPYRYDHKDDIPEDIAFAFASWHWGNTGEESRDLSILFPMVPWIVKQEPEDLFLPQRLMSHLRFPKMPETALEILLRPLQANWVGLPDPIRVPKTPGRNDPCLCGSGKKHKRCCGAFSRESEAAELALSPFQS